MDNLSDLFQDFKSVIEGDVDVLCKKPTLILAITARTGSTQLCSFLESMGMFGSPDEILNTRGVVQKNIARDGVTSFADYIDKLTSIDAPCFSFKTSWCDFEPISHAWMRIFPNAKFVFLDRFDVVAQAFSLFKAINTGHWHSKIDSKSDFIEISLDKIDVKRIQKIMKSLVCEKFQWENFFFMNKIIVGHIYYEIIKDDWVTAANLIANQFGFNNNYPCSGSFIRLSRESDLKLIEDFKEMYGYKWLSV
ncbi:LPS sulfotransferase NodH [Desulfomicrobium macestii]|uniref:LPS sulfotransferase NodH n=1 Tax=Desulfomicrobium macestii TaxID=90731 RepID=A0ABR9H9C6_9BACT|nr:Stf0 family sulfotransferase [Desulfomicrobium macestii]MBE1427300.1 LPS sulfotransferase NodH [Desulfomicrobium macestii]